jgi:superfamily II DNA or RNA helicase
MKITVLNPVHCQIDKKHISIIKPCLKYRASWFKRNKYGGGSTKYYDSFFIDKDSGQFLSGFLPKVKKYCDDKNIPMQIIDVKTLGSDILTPNLPGITFKPFQESLIHKAVKKQRGVILSPTGSGKTIIAIGVVSMFPKAKVLFLCHSIAILRQTMAEFKKFGFDDVSFVGDGEKVLAGQIVIASIQSVVTIPSSWYYNRFDITIIDEVHHLSGKKTQYFQFMERNESIIRLGFTATMPSKEESKLCIEGMLGPVIGEYKVEEGIKDGMIARPYINLVSVPPVSAVLELKKYRDIYRKGIVENRPRNRLIMTKTSARVKDGKSTLILVKEIDHGKILKTLGKSLFDLDITYIQGSTESDVRERVRKSFSEKKIKIVICTVIWKEGVDIPSLDCVINAAGGKSEIATLQAIGRGLRRTDEKDEVEVIDFLDPYKFLAQHTVLRLQIYVRMGWL